MVKRIFALMMVLFMVGTTLSSMSSVWAEDDGSEVGGWDPIVIPDDWQHLVSDHFDVSGVTSVADYTGGTGFSSKYSADLACTDQSDATFKAQVSNTSKQTVPQIAAGGYFSRSTKAGAIKTYRKMNAPINMTADGEYYMTFDFYAYADGLYGTHQRFAFVDSGSESNQLNFGAESTPSVKKNTVTFRTGAFTYPNASTAVISPAPTSLFQYSGKYTVTMHVSARASAQDILRMRVYYNDPNGEVIDESPSFMPGRWDIVQRMNLSYTNLDTFLFQTAIGSGGNYTSQFDNLDIYKGAAVKVSSDKDASEASIVEGRTLTLAGIPATNAVGNAQTMESIKWMDNTTGETLATGNPSFTVPQGMKNHILVAQVAIKDTVTEKTTTYYPINEYVRPDIDLLALYFASSDGRAPASESSLSAFTPLVLRADVARNNSLLTAGNVYLTLEQYSEYDVLKNTYSTSSISYTYSTMKVTDLPATSAKKLMVTLDTKNAQGAATYEPGDYYIARAFYVADPTSAPNIKIDIPLTPGMVSPQFIDTDLIIPGGKLLKLPQQWRSALYPEDWTLGFKDNKGRSLHDFSYAGYHRGEDPIPDNPPGQVYNVVKDFYADPTGIADSTMAIQNAINAAQTAGGGTVYLPEGTFSITQIPGTKYCLHINKSNVVLKGAGPDKTHLYVNQDYVRDLNVIHLEGPGWYYPSAGSEKTIMGDVLPADSTVIPLNNVAGYNVSDWIILGLQRKVTEAFAEEVGEPSWSGESETGGIDSIVFYRQITAVDTNNNTVTIDAPTMHDLIKRDGMRTYKLDGMTQEVGLQDFSIGMKENTKPNSDDGKPQPDVGKAWGENDHTIPGTKGYDCANSYAIFIAGCTNGWVKNVDSYKPAGNVNGTHIASNFLWIHQSRGITVADSNVAHTNYQGGAGNGYAFKCGGNNNLYINGTTEVVRHGYSFLQMATSGNVIYNCSSKNNLYVNDFHMHYSQSNLIDSFHMDGVGWDAQYRAYGTIKHGQTATQSVFWNCQGGTVTTKQWGNGYAIGCESVNNSLGLGDTTVPIDYVEGTGSGGGLVPQSLYMDQMNKRLNRNNVVIQSINLTNAGNVKLTDNGLVNDNIIVKAVLNYNKAVGVPTVFAALYEKSSGELVNLKIADQPEDSYTFIVDGFDMTGLEPTEYYLKVFVWDSAFGMKVLLSQPVKFDSSGRVQ